MQYASIIWDWFTLWLGQYACDFSTWIHHTALFAVQFFYHVVRFFTLDLPRVLWLIYDGFAGYGWNIVGIYHKIKLTFEDWWTKVVTIFKDLWDNVYTLIYHWYNKIRIYVISWYDKAGELFDRWWTKATQLLVDWWGLVYQWFVDWCKWFIDFYTEHKLKVVYLFTEAWEKIWWFVYTRWEIIFYDWENNIAGWVTFIDDPAQALWDWLEPRLAELTEDFLYRIW